MQPVRTGFYDCFLQVCIHPGAQIDVFFVRALFCFFLALPTRMLFGRGGAFSQLAVLGSARVTVTFCCDACSCSSFFPGWVDGSIDRVASGGFGETSRACGGGGGKPAPTRLAKARHSRRYGCMWKFGCICEGCVYWNKHILRVSIYFLFPIVGFCRLPHCPPSPPRLARRPNQGQIGGGFWCVYTCMQVPWIVQ